MTAARTRISGCGPVLPKMERALAMTPRRTWPARNNGLGQVKLVSFDGGGELAPLAGGDGEDRSVRVF